MFSGIFQRQYHRLRRHAAIGGRVRLDAKTLELLVMGVRGFRFGLRVGGGDLVGVGRLDLRELLGVGCLGGR